MSEFISNKSCEMCKKIETGLTEMRIGSTKHYLCYKCLATLSLDMIEFSAHNLRDEFKANGYNIYKTNEQGYVIENIAKKI